MILVLVIPSHNCGLSRTNNGCDIQPLSGCPSSVLNKKPHKLQFLWNVLNGGKYEDDFFDVDVEDDDVDELDAFVVEVDEHRPLFKYCGMICVTNKDLEWTLNDRPDGDHDTI